MANRIFFAAWTLLAPLIVLAQQAGEIPSAEPVAPSTGVSFLWAVPIVVLVAAVFFGARAIRRNRGGPHGPQAPTPRAP